MEQLRPSQGKFQPVIGFASWLHEQEDVFRYLGSLLNSADHGLGLQGSAYSTRVNVELNLRHVTIKFRKPNEVPKASRRSVWIKVLLHFDLLQAKG